MKKEERKNSALEARSNRRVSIALVCLRHNGRADRLLKLMDIIDAIINDTLRGHRIRQDDKEDVRQEVWMKLMIIPYQRIEHFGALVRRMTVAEVRNFLRARKSRRKHVAFCSEFQMDKKLEELFA